MTIDETVDRFNSLYELNKQAEDNRQQYCCGTVVELQDNSNIYIAVTRCDSSSTVQLLLDALSKKGFKVEHPSMDKALYVYMKRCSLLV